MKTKFVLIIIIVVLVAMYFLMHARIWPEPEPCDVGFEHYHFGFCSTNLFSVSGAFAQTDDNSVVSFAWEDGIDHKNTLGNIGEMYWLQASYSGKENSVATLRVIDPDLVQFPDSVDFIRIHVHSDTDPLGTDIVLTNTPENPGFFEGDVIFTHDFSSSRGVLLVSDGDTISAKYVDTTLPDDADSETYEVVATAIISGPRGPIEMVLATSLRIEDLKQNRFSDNVIPLGHQVLFSADLNAQTQDIHNFAYLVQVQDEKGRTMSLSWLSGTILPKQTITTSQSWIPDLAGKYFVTVFVWESVDNPTALSPPLSVEFVVE
ncbi:hypothetical protein NZNM25_07870 [Nitrosopumilus zosterae]|uniref:Uncharacterized protein n=1 Tax=Nitrosopumilus zosterae TaxID=718286 RepID=A0A2S2KQR2_9ARCH|nr:hypothetical protein [Nitrosopumilus zosterae]BDQ30572.1 hypothetical protein NZOSNM25_000677 [Nitrosopumilus zosterae]GBH33996.1 hypothetical protein NZNM25_07870 [Nitrosopumilus zosterae]